MHTLNVHNNNNTNNIDSSMLSINNKKRNQTHNASLIDNKSIYELVSMLVFLNKLINQFIQI